MAKCGEKLGKMANSGENWQKVGKSSEKWKKWGKVAKSGEKWQNGIFTKWPAAAILDD